MKGPRLDAHKEPDRRPHVGEVDGAQRVTLLRPVHPAADVGGGSLDLCAHPNAVERSHDVRLDGQSAAHRRPDRTAFDELDIEGAVVQRAVPAQPEPSAAAETKIVPVIGISAAALPPTSAGLRCLIGCGEGFGFSRLHYRFGVGEHVGDGSRGFIRLVLHGWDVRQ